MGLVGDGYLQISASSRAKMNWANLRFGEARMSERRNGGGQHRSSEMVSLVSRTGFM